MLGIDGLVVLIEQRHASEGTTQRRLPAVRTARERLDGKGGGKSRD